MRTMWIKLVVKPSKLAEPCSTVIPVFKEMAQKWESFRETRKRKTFVFKCAVTKNEFPTPAPANTDESSDIYNLGSMDSTDNKQTCPIFHPTRATSNVVGRLLGVLATAAVWQSLLNFLELNEVE